MLPSGPHEALNPPSVHLMFGPSWAKGCAGTAVRPIVGLEAGKIGIVELHLVFNGHLEETLHSLHRFTPCP